MPFMHTPFSHFEFLHRVFKLIPVSLSKQLYLKIPWKNDKEDNENINENIINIHSVSFNEGNAAARAFNINCIFYNLAIIRNGRRTYKLFKNPIS